jgi:NitT/TauT family transport system permease protein
VNNNIYLPSPLSVLAALKNISQSSDLATAIPATSFRVFLSFLLSSTIGVTLGLLCGLSHTAYEVFEPIISILRSIPVISVIIIALIWFKSNYAPVFAGFLMTFPIIWENTAKGIQSTDGNLLEMARLYRVGLAQTIKYLYLPSSKPYITAAFISSMGLSWKVIAATEVFSLPRFGIGSKLHDSKVYLEFDSLLAWTLIIVLLSYISEIMLRLVFSINKIQKNN